jgi:polysaccharide biosynthesis/export protein
MVHRRSSWFLTLSSSACTASLVAGIAASQDVRKAKPSPVEAAKTAKKPAPQSDLSDPARCKALIDKMIGEYDLTPHPMAQIPDNPPPHEGALISVQHVVEPTDLILVEVLDALPGRPISGERLLRPDGTIALGFYGDVQVRGLSLPQIKVAVIKQLRNFLTDDQLGLVELIESSDADSMDKDGQFVPPFPEGAINPFEAPHQPTAPKQKTSPEPRLDGAAIESESLKIVPPEKSTHVYVDTTAYNAMNYYVGGDVLVPGKMPYTGHETVLDAMNYAGGLLPTADPKAIRLVRPGKGGRPARIYNVDLEAIQERGDATANYQLFPGDRLYVGRDEIVKKTVELDRLTAPIHTIVGAMQQEATMLRATQTASPDHADELYKELLDFWLKQLSSRGELKFDEQKLREALSRQRKLTPPAAPAPK